jgi:DinB superfamily
MKQLSDALLKAIDFAEPNLRAIPNGESLKPALPGGWSRRELLAHLIDSAANNHVRFLAAMLNSELEMNRYNQDGNVKQQSPNAVAWPLLVDLFTSYNRYLAHVVARIPPEKYEVPCRIIPYEPVTLEYLANDYLTHLLHHLEQIGIAPPQKEPRP